MFKTILVTTDFSDSSTAAMQCGLELAALSRSTLHVMHVVADPSAMPWSAEAFAMPFADLITQWQEESRRELERALPPETRANAVIITPVGSPYREIID